MRAAADFLAEIVDQASDVGPFCAGDLEIAEGRFEFPELETVDVDQARFSFDLDPLAGELVE